MNSQQTAKQFGRPSLPHVRTRQSYFEWNWRRSLVISSNLNESIIFCSLSFMSRTISLACRGSCNVHVLWKIITWQWKHGADWSDPPATGKKPQQPAPGRPGTTWTITVIQNEKFLRQVQFPLPGQIQATILKYLPRTRIQSTQAQCHWQVHVRVWLIFMI